MVTSLARFLEPNFYASTIYALQDSVWQHVDIHVFYDGMCIHVHTEFLWLGLGKLELL
jgi:hypothetical protein